MNESEDKELHQLIRKQLSGYQVEFNPQHWVELRQQMARKQRWRKMGWISGGLLLLLACVLGIEMWQSTPQPYKQTIKTIAHSPKTRSLSTLPRWKESSKSKSSPRLYQPQPPPLILAPIQPLLLSKNEYLPTKPLMAKDLKINPLSLKFATISLPSPEEAAIKQQMNTGVFGADSTSFQVLSRNAGRWANTVLVCDFTSSMYPYSTQLFVWLRQNAQHPAIKGTLFFTDCDSLGQETIPQNTEGKMFITRERTTHAVLPLMIAAARNTLGNQKDAENDVEALIAAQKHFPEAKQLVLIADNSSRVKDLHRLAEIHLPVRVVLCGVSWDTTQAFQSDFFEIAARTRGSLHTLQDDFSPSQLSHRDWIKVGPRYYWYNTRKQRFVVSRFRERPRLFLGLFWL